MSNSPSKTSTLQHVCNSTLQQLCTLYSIGEAQWMIRIIFEHLKGWSRVDLAIRANDELSEFIVDKVNSITQRLLKHEPLQYILGEARFFGMNLRVTPAVLIPRAETEELVDIIIDDANNRHDLSALDICTGSGCIAIALSRNLPFASVTAIDISDDALSIASENAKATHTSIDFIKADALNLTAPTKPGFDIIVSNPPYIAEYERAAMERNVLEYEPELALFVPNDDPLKFYRAISLYALSALQPGGKLYFEINPIFSNELSLMLKTHGWNNVEILPDSHKKMRFAKAVAPI